MGELRTVVLLTLLAGCGRVGFDSSAAFGDGPDGGDPSADADPADDGSTVLGTFAEPVVVSSLSSSDRDDDPILTDDMLEVFFTSTRPPSNSAALWTSKRSSLDDDWDVPQLVTELDSSMDDRSPFVSADGLTIWFERAGPGAEIWTSTRASRTAPWQTASPVSELNVSSYDSNAAVDATGLRMLMVSNRGGGGDLDIYEATRASAGANWGTPAERTEINSSGEDTVPFLSRDGLTTIFASVRAGGAGSRDLYIAERSSTDEPFSAPVGLDELNTSGTDTDPWLSPDERTLYMARGGGAGADIYIAER